MIAKTKAIILKNTNYSESSVISKMYTRDFGVRSYILQSIRKGKSAIRPSMIQPLSLVDIDIYNKPNMSLGRVRELKNNPLLINIQDNILRKSIALFYIDIINHCLTQELCEQELFDFLHTEILKLERETSLTFLPHHFLIGLSVHLGVQPQGEFTTHSPYFSIEEGVFLALEGTDTFTRLESQLLSELLRDQAQATKVSSLVRKNVLRQLIRYYQYHIIKNKEIKSLDILSELLA